MIVQESSLLAGPVSSTYVEAVKTSRIPKKTQANTLWATKLWQEWACSRIKNISPDETGHALDITT